MFSWLLSGALAEEAAEVVEAVEKEPTWFDNAVKKLIEAPLTVWIAVLVLVALGVILLVVTRTSKSWNAKMLSFAALSIALSFVLSCVRLYRMPTGGSVTPGSMLPLMLFSVSFGIGPGLVAGLGYGLLQYLQGGWWLNVWQFLLDYLLAFAALGLAGFAYKKKDRWIFIFIPVAAVGRALCAILAGLMWVADTPVEELTIGTVQFSSPLLYSIVYNGAYLIPDTLICLLLAFLIAKPLVKIMKTK